MDEARCGVTSQLVNGCAAHASRRLLTRHLKTCLLVTLFTINYLRVSHNRPRRMGVRLLHRIEAFELDARICRAELLIHCTNPLVALLLPVLNLASIGPL